MIIAYSGKSEYCYSNSLYMCLRSAATAPGDVPEVGFLECLTTMPFGTMYLRDDKEPMAFFSPPTIDPDAGLTRALDALGWTCDETFGGDEAEALERLRAALRSGPALVGPVDLGELPYNPHAASLRGGDHFVVALEMDDERVRLHDPYGFPYAVLSPTDLLTAWRAERIPYRRGPYTLRGRFQQMRAVSRDEAIAATLPLAKSTLLADPGGPAVYGGLAALKLLAHDLRGDVPAPLAEFLVYFSLPLAARRCADASSFLREAGNDAAAEHLIRKARLFGDAQALATRGQWSAVAGVIDRIDSVESEVIASL